ncbi:MAG: PRC and DUF2382 domain-containing protein [Actinobacteria bacterium]|nr:PRC and DUF2382 domain-containing protein [Actinomycetota bacterium]
MRDDTITMERLGELRGANVYDSTGDKIGKVVEIFYDEQTNYPEWIGIGTGFFGSKRVLVPVVGARVQESGVTVPYASDHVKDAPDIDSDEMSQEREKELYSYYGLSYSERRSDIGLPQDSISESEGTRGKASDKRAVTRSEEEFKVGKRQTETGTARLRKWVETEPAQADVELKRETARVRRESIDRPVSGAEIREEEIEVPLRAEQAVVEKRTVAKERVGIEKNVETRHETVADEVRKERVEVEMDNVEERKR